VLSCEPIRTRLGTSINNALNREDQQTRLAGSHPSSRGPVVVVQQSAQTFSVLHRACVCEMVPLRLNQVVSPLCPTTRSNWPEAFPSALGRTAPTKKLDCASRKLQT
jgi:hypothetical protein